MIVLFVLAASAKMVWRLSWSWRVLGPRWRAMWPLTPAAMSWVAAQTALMGVMVGFERYLCLKNAMQDILVPGVFLYIQALASITLGGGAKDPPF